MWRDVGVVLEHGCSSLPKPTTRSLAVFSLAPFLFRSSSILVTSCGIFLHAFFTPCSPLFIESLPCNLRTRNSRGKYFLVLTRRCLHLIARRCRLHLQRRFIHSSSTVLWSEERVLPIWTFYWVLGSLRSEVSYLLRSRLFAFETHGTNLSVLRAGRSTYYLAIYRNILNQIRDFRCSK